MRFNKLDLNLLVALDALLEERSVSQAADRLHLSQSATSGALGRLRQYFGDELLVLKGRQMVLTPRAETLMQPVRAVLDQIDLTIAQTEPFDPRTSVRGLAIMASDYVFEVLLRQTLLDLATEAPGITFELWPMVDDLVEELRRGQADLLITIDTAISTELPSKPLFEDDFVVVGWTGNAALDQPMTRQLYERLGHVVARFGRSRVPSFEAWALKSQSINRRIEVAVPTFMAVPRMIVGSNRIATMHRKLAQSVAASMPLRVIDMPFEIPRICMAAQWAPSASNDEAVSWLVARLQAAALTAGFRPIGLADS